jgi:hypothetical protein
MSEELLDLACLAFYGIRAWHVAPSHSQGTELGRLLVLAKKEGTMAIAFVNFTPLGGC